MESWTARRSGVSTDAPSSVSAASASFPMMNKAQADIAYGFTTILRSDPAFYAYWLMNNILGEYSIGGRLGDSIRERQGMAYYVFSGARRERGAGTAVDSRRRQSRQRRSRACLDR